MAKDEHPREDLIRDATALARRIEFTFLGSIISRNVEPVVCGFRPNGAFSIYFGEDPVYQFNASGQLRRGFLGGKIFKADSGGLASLTRERTSGAVVLHRHDLTSEEKAEFLAEMNRRFDHLRDCIERRGVRIERQSPLDEDIMGEVADWLRQYDRTSIADSPRVG